MTDLEMIVFSLLMTLMATAVVGLSLFVRELFHRDVAPPDLHTPWEDNPWLRDKNLIVGRKS